MIWGHAAGNDLTRRDLQAEAKASPPALGHGQGLSTNPPWSARSVPAPCPTPRCAARSTVPQGKRRKLSEMIWTPASIIAALSRMVSLSPGDLIFTGTPAGVGPLNRGDTCKVEIEGLQSATVTIA